MLRIEVALMHPPRQVPRDVQVAFDERTVDRQLCCFRWELLRSPTFHLLMHWLKIPLHPVHADRQRVFEREVLRVLR